MDISKDIQRYMQHKQERAVSTDMQHGQAAWTCSMNMQRRNAPRIYITVMQHGHGHGQAA
jgi:hypothetical protein